MYKKAMAVLCVFYFLVFGGILFFMETEKTAVPVWYEDVMPMMGKAAFPENMQLAGIIPMSQEATFSDAAQKTEISYSEKQYGEREVPLTMPDNCLDEERELFSEKEVEVLQRIVEAEAGGEDANGKLLVANVVLNRVENEEFPNTISEVVFQNANGVTQFSPVANGRYYQVTVSENTIDAVERALSGEDISEGALYFAARKYANSNSMKWFDENLTFLFQHGGHEFFK